MSRSALDRTRDIVQAIQAIRQFEAAGRDEVMVFDAVRMRLLEIGEAVNGLPSSLRDAEPNVPWNQIIGMRNWMAHRYFDTVHAYVWATVDTDLEPLLAAVNRIAARLNEPSVDRQTAPPSAEDSAT